MDPSRIVLVDDISDETLINIAEHIEESKDFSHFVYRESELDALCRLVEDELKHKDRERTAEQQRQLERLFRLAVQAHDLVGDRKPIEAALTLRQALRLN